MEASGKGKGMADHKIREMVDFLAYLARCAVIGEKPENSRLSDVNLDELYILAVRHSLAAVVAEALESAGIQHGLFKEAAAKSLRKVIALEIDKIQLLQKLDDNGIWYMPLKGSVLKDDYPKLGMREMSDYDILYDEHYAHKVRQILQKMGYAVDEFNMHNVDSYEKPPVYRFEMHRKLFSPYEGDRLYSYYSDVGRLLIRDEDNHFGLHFTHEDFYVYMVAHEYKHYVAGGSGLRFLLDTWVFLRKYGDKLDWKRIETEFDTLGISQFEKENRELSQALFEKGELNAEQEKMLLYMVDSGTFGTVNNAVRQQVEQYGGGAKGKLQYIKNRMLIPEKTLESAYPFFYRHRLLIPFLYLYRPWRAVFRNRKKVLAEFRTLLSDRVK